MAGRGDEVEKDVDTVVAETRVTLDTRLLGENVIVLALEVTDDFAEAADLLAQMRPPWLDVVTSVPGLVVDLVTETGGVDDGQRDAGSFLVQL